ncbi:MAG: DNA adenine methylase [Paraglaciecola sp.]
MRKLTIKTKKVRSPLRYPGGKSRALKSIIPLVPNDFKEFREPFVGGGSVFIYLQQEFADRQFWINDLYTELYEFWDAAGQDIDKMLGQIWAWRRSHKDGRELYRFLIDNMKGFSKNKKAAAFFILNRITFSGTSESGGYSKMAFEKRFTESSIARVEAILPIMEEVKVTNWDFQKVIEAPGEDVFLFLDPPYHSAAKSGLYGKNGNLHKGFDHERLAETLRKSSHRWLITYDDSEYIRDLFSFAKITNWNLTYGMRNVNEKATQKATEVFVSNY